MTEMTTMTEFEENVSFDADDPDFAPSPPVIRNVLRDARRFAEKFDIKGRHILMFFNRQRCFDLSILVQNLLESFEIAMEGIIKHFDARICVCGQY